MPRGVLLTTIGAQYHALQVASWDAACMNGHGRFEAERRTLFNLVGQWSIVVYCSHGWVYGCTE
jgi:hypothetical protein